MKIVICDPNKCVGCRNCEYACSFAHYGVSDSNKSNIKVDVFIDEKTYAIASTCNHCEDAWCKQVCPSGAITRNLESNAIEINEKSCVGCKMCILACPFGSIHFDEINKISHKCDLCKNKEPECVKHCISGALTFENPLEVAINKRKQKLLAQAENSKEINEER